MNVLILIVGEIAYSLMSIQKKRWRNRQIDALGIWAVFIFMVPVLLALAYVLYAYTDVVRITQPYMLYTLGWFVVCGIHNALRVFLYKYQTLTEFFLFKFVFATLLAYGVDVWYFKYAFSWPAFIGLLGVLGGALILHFDGHKNAFDLDKPAYRLSLGKVILAFSVIVVISTISFTLSKQALLLQNPFFHGAFANSLLFVGFWLVGRQKLNRAIKAGHVRCKEVLVVCLLMFIGIFAEAWALKALPLTLITLFTVLIPLTMFGTYDSFSKALNLKRPGTILGAILAIGGLAVYLGDQLYG